MKLDLEAKLAAHDIRPTAVRTLVLEALGTDDRAYSLNELEAKLGTVDKSTIFRTLTLLWEHNMVHRVEDSHGQTRYAPCIEGCHCHDHHEGIHDLHPHFECEHCGRVWCLRSENIPSVKLPEGFYLHTAALVLRGICSQCHR